MVKITWTVHLANRKPNFCEFHGQAGAKDTHLVNGKSEPFFFLSFSNNASSDLKVRNFALNTTALRKKWLEPTWVRSP
jgi:hypothetical protein